MSTTLPSTPPRLLPNYFSFRQAHLCDNLSPVKFQGPHGTCNLHAVLALMETKLRMRETTREGKLAIGPLSVEHVLDRFAAKIEDVEKDEVSNEIRQCIMDGIVFEFDYVCEGQNGKKNAYSAERAEIFKDMFEGENLTFIAADNLRAFFRSDFSDGSFNVWLRNELFNNGPLIVAFRLREGFYMLGKNEILGPETDYERKEDGSFLWHTCLLVGWNIDDGLDEYFEIQNSYGPWSDDGFGWLIADDVEEAYMWDVVAKGN